MVSRDDRTSESEVYRNFYFTGTPDGSGAVDNKIGADIDRLRSYFFSPVDPRFRIEFDRDKPAHVRAQAMAAGNWLSREFQFRSVDLCYAEALKWALIESCGHVKLLWNRGGFDPWFVAKNFFGVFQEGIADLDRQDAFVHSTFMTPSSFARTIRGHPEEAAIMRRIEREAQQGMDQPSGLKQLLIGGTIPVNLTPPQTAQAGGWVEWMKAPRPVLDPQTLASLIEVNELWVIDNEREDYSTFQLVGDIVIDGALQRRNLSGVKGMHPFIKTCPNGLHDYYWGRSEVADMMMPQEALSQQVNGINRVMRMQEDPPTSLQGIRGDAQKKRAALMKPGGFIAEIDPQFKVENHAPHLADQALPWLAELNQISDRASGFEAPISRGHGEPGVRSGTHGETLVRMASPRLRDRALISEREYSDVGQFGFELARVKVGERFELHYSENGQSQATAFTLGQIPDDYRITVDSHSASPAFSEDAYRRIMDLVRSKAINDVDLIRLTHPPGEDTLVANAEERHKEQAQLLASHPELLKRQSAHR